MSLGLPSLAQAGHWSEEPQALPDPRSQVGGKGEGTALPLGALARRDICTPITKAPPAPSQSPGPSAATCRPLPKPWVRPHPTRPGSLLRSPAALAPTVLPGSSAGPISAPHWLLQATLCSLTVGHNQQGRAPTPTSRAQLARSCCLNPGRPPGRGGRAQGHRVGEPHGTGGDPPALTLSSGPNAPLPCWRRDPHAPVPDEKTEAR